MEGVIRAIEDLTLAMVILEQAYKNLPPFEEIEHIRRHIKNEITALSHIITQLRSTYEE